MTLLGMAHVINIKFHPSSIRACSGQGWEVRARRAGPVARVGTKSLGLEGSALSPILERWKMCR